MSCKHDELGAHVSVAGGVDRAPARAEAIGARVFQIFTKQPSRWAEPTLPAEAIARFRAECARLEAAFTVSHDSYLINLASPDPALWRRSADCFRGELERARLLGLDGVVTHPGNATDGDAPGGIERNAAAITEALESVAGDTRVLLELTAGAGTSVGGSFEELAKIIDGIPGAHRDRMGVCIDTCHAWVAGYDLAGDYEGVWTRADDAFGMNRVALFHMNDARAQLGSRLDRHADIGRGTIGPEPFRRLMTDRRFRAIPKILETPKGDDGVAADRRNLEVLRSLRAQGGRAGGAEPRGLAILRSPEEHPRQNRER